MRLKSRVSGVLPVTVVRILARMNVGGPAIHAVLLSDGLNKKRFRSILVTGVVSKSEGDMLYLAGQYGVSPMVIPELGREISWRDDLIALWKLYRLLLRERPDIVHTHTAKAGTLGRVAAVLARVPVRIHTFHGHVFHHYFSPWKTRMILFIERLLSHLTTIMVAISPAQLTELTGRYRLANAGKFKVVPIGLDLSPFLDIDRRTVEENSGGGHSCGITIGLIGRLVPVKNPFLAVRAFARSVWQGSLPEHSRLLIVGDGELRPSLQAHVDQIGLHKEVLLAGWQQNLPKVYRALDFIMLTSDNEGTPVVLMEAMAAGLPFVATKVGGVEDLVVGGGRVIGDETGRPLFASFSNGLLVKPGDEEGLAAAVAYLSSNPAVRRCMGEEGRKFVRVRFSRERLIRDIEEMYRHCLETTSTGAGRNI